MLINKDLIVMNQYWKDKKLQRNWDIYNQLLNTLIISDESGVYKDIKNILDYCRQVADVNSYLISKDIKVLCPQSPDIEAFVNSILRQTNMVKNDLISSVEGDGFLKAETDEVNKLLNIKNLNSYQINNIIYDEYDNFNLIEFINIVHNLDTDKDDTIKEVYTKEKMERYINDELVETIPNKLGIIPIYQFSFKNGECSFEVIARKIDRLNELISILRQHVLNSSDVRTVLKFADKRNIKALKDAQANGQNIENNFYDGEKIIAIGKEDEVDLLESKMENFTPIISLIQEIKDHIEKSALELIYFLDSRGESGDAKKQRYMLLKAQINSIRQERQKEMRRFIKDLLRIGQALGRISVSDIESVDFQIRYGSILEDDKIEDKDLIKMFELGLIDKDEFRQMKGITEKNLSNIF
jgi:hypothetical protein